MAVNRAASPENTVLLLTSEIIDGRIVCASLPREEKAKGPKHAPSGSSETFRLRLDFASTSAAERLLLAEEINGTVRTQACEKHETQGLHRFGYRSPIFVSASCSSTIVVRFVIVSRLWPKHLEWKPLLSGCFRKLTNT